MRIFNYTHMKVSFEPLTLKWYVNLYNQKDMEQLTEDDRKSIRRITPQGAKTFVQLFQKET